MLVAVGTGTLEPEAGTLKQAPQNEGRPWDRQRHGAEDMATIQNLRLELIDHNRGSRTATFRVRYQARLSPLERNLKGLRFKEEIQLCGAYSLDPEDFLFELATAVFQVDRKGVVRRERLITVDDSILEEGGVPQPTEQLYAKVWVSPLLPASDFDECNLMISYP